jgi:hypothetical protein
MAKIERPYPHNLRPKPPFVYENDNYAENYPILSILLIYNAAAAAAAAEAAECLFYT